MHPAAFFWRFAAGASAANLPFVLTLCDSASPSGPDSFCPDGLTLTIAGSEGVLERLEQIAPSQYQANWRRSGGVIDGGPAVALLREEIMPALGENLVHWLEGFDVANTTWQPPIPLDFMSEVAISQKQFTLPAFAWPLSLQKLSSYPYPVWQIFHAPWRRSMMFEKEEGLDPSFVLQGVLVRLREIEPSIRRESFGSSEKNRTQASSQIYGIRVHGFTEKGLKTWQLLRNEAEGDREGDREEDSQVVPQVDREGESVELRLERAVRMTGLTFFMDTSVSFDLTEDFLVEDGEEDCELALDQLLPSSIFLDMDEADHHAKKTEARYVTPQYHDIELPAHLATPVFYRTRFRLVKGKNLYRDDGLILHDRYIIKFDGQTEELDNYTTLEIQPPSATIVCAHTRSKKLRFIKGAFDSIQSTPASPNNPHAVAVRGMILDARYEAHAAILTTIAVVIATFCVLREFIPILIRVSKSHQD